MPYDKDKKKIKNTDLVRSRNDPVSLARNVCFTAPGKATCIAAMCAEGKGNTD